jgi:hypothetical protein
MIVNGYGYVRRFIERVKQLFGPIHESDQDIRLLRGAPAGIPTGITNGLV